jgi:hypothetical protein
LLIWGFAIRHIVVIPELNLGRVARTSWDLATTTEGSTSPATPSTYSPATPSTSSSTAIAGSQSCSIMVIKTSSSSQFHFLFVLNSSIYGWKFLHIETRYDEKRTITISRQTTMKYQYFT